MIGKQDFSTAIEECVKRWPNLERQLDVYYSHLNWMDFDAFDTICRRFVENFRSMPLIKDFKEGHAGWKEAKDKAQPQAEYESPYQVHYRVHCRQCGTFDKTCIEEPLGSDYRCRECYSGLPTDKIRKRFKVLTSIIGNGTCEKEFTRLKQEWAPNSIEGVPF